MKHIHPERVKVLSDYLYSEGWYTQAQEITDLGAERDALEAQLVRYTELAKAAQEIADTLVLERLKRGQVVGEPSDAELHLHTVLNRL